MAHYNREILVPYLENLCCVELLYQKVNQQCKKIEAEYWKCWKLARPSVLEPTQPEKQNNIKNPAYWKDLILTSAVCTGGMGFVIGGCLIFWKLVFAEEPITLINVITFLLLLLIATGILAGLRLMVLLGNDEDVYDRQRKSYREELRRYEENVKQASEYEKRANQIHHRLDNVSYRKLEIEQLRQRMYASNIIPSKYRTLPAVCYLYDYFSTSRETDLDRVIQTMLLDDINSKLSDIIRRLDEVILNQKIQMAQMDDLHNEYRGNNERTMKAIAQAEQDRRLQADYLAMIAANTEANAYFSAATYLSRELL